MFACKTILNPVVLRGGVTIDSSETVNSDNLRMLQGNTVYDLGSGAGVDPGIPLLADITQLLPGENGWQINPDGTYHLIYNTVGNCQGCEMVLHFYGMLVPVSKNGDINGDSVINVADILLAERHLQGSISLTPGQIMRGDVAPDGVGDGVVNVADVSILYNLVFQ